MVSSDGVIFLQRASGHVLFGVRDKRNARRACRQDGPVETGEGACSAGQGGDITEAVLAEDAIGQVAAKANRAVEPQRSACRRPAQLVEALPG